MFVLLYQVPKLAQTFPSFVQGSLRPRFKGLLACHDGIIEICSGSYWCLPQFFFSSGVNATNCSFGATSLAINNLEESMSMEKLSKRFSGHSHCRMT